MNSATLEAGQALDALVAEKMMGCRVIRPEHGDVYPLCGCENSPHDKPGTFRIQNYSTEIAAAWEVFEKMRLMGWGPEIWGMNTKSRVRIYVAKAYTFLEEESQSVPLALCRAALKALSCDTGIPK